MLISTFIKVTRGHPCDRKAAIQLFIVPSSHVYLHPLVLVKTESLVSSPLIVQYNSFLIIVQSLTNKIIKSKSL